MEMINELKEISAGTRVSNVKKNIKIYYKNLITNIKFNLRNL